MTDVMLTIAGEEVYLLAERALWWPNASTLIVADLHWGKASTFRATGIPIPIGTTSDDLARLDSALTRTGARRMVVLGDLFHAKAGRIASHTLAELRRWRSLAAPVEILLVRGNHDRHAGDPPSDLRINCVNAPAFVPPFVFRHEPVESGDAYGLAGHVHPGITLMGRGLQRETLPCFVIGQTGAWFRRLAASPASGVWNRVPASGLRDSGGRGTGSEPATRLGSQCLSAGAA